jgi:hypothetical protein
MGNYRKRRKHAMKKDENGGFRVATLGIWPKTPHFKIFPWD